MTKEEVMTAIKECAERLGHAPSLTELQSMTRVTKRTIRKHFCTYVLALQACGLERSGCGYYVSMETLFKEWAGTVRRLGKIPTIAEFELRGKFSARPLMTRFKNLEQCSAMPAGIRQERRAGRRVGRHTGDHCRAYGAPEEVGNPFGNAFGNGNEIENVAQRAHLWNAFADGGDGERSDE